MVKKERSEWGMMCCFNICGNDVFRDNLSGPFQLFLENIGWLVVRELNGELIEN